jgi:hypothetical protein
MTLLGPLFTNVKKIVMIERRELENVEGEG